MTTLLRLKGPNDKRAHTCDARCYNAKGKDCHCFCKGANHGRGFEYAINYIITNTPTFTAIGCTLSKAIEDAVKALKSMRNI
jgi:hypothetical protein